MARKHQPGCPCCTPSTCCTNGDEAIPTITITGYTQTAVEGTNCCATFTFTPNDTSYVSECCDEVMVSTLEKECLSEFYTLQLPEPRVATSNPGCPLPDTMCCIANQYKIGQIYSTSSIDLTSYFIASIRVLDLKVIWAKEEIDCGTGAECRYSIRVVWRLSWNGGIYTVYRYYGSITGSSTSACFSYDGTQDDSWDETSCADICTDWDSGDSELCRWVGGQGGQELGISCADCLYDDGTACIQRIRFFSTKPSGAVTFSSSDVIGSCEEPACNWDCSGYDQEICIAGPVDMDPPIWCDTAPTITTDTNTYDIVSSCAGGLTVTIPDAFDCCDTTTVICNTPNDCEPAATITQTCDEVNWNIPTTECDPAVCRQPTIWLNDIRSDGACYCYNGSTLPSYFDYEGDCTTSPCDTTCCYEPYSCVACPYCYPKYQTGVGQYWSNVDITITPTCGTYVPPADCCWTPPTITLNIS